MLNFRYIKVMRNQLKEFPNGLNLLKKHENLVNSVETGNLFDSIITDYQLLAQGLIKQVIILRV